MRSFVKFGLIAFLLVLTFGSIGWLYSIGRQLPPNERHIYALTASRNDTALYNIYTDITLPFETRKLAVGQYIFLIEKDRLARAKMEKELVAKRDAAAAEESKDVYRFGLSRLNQQLIDTRQNELAQQLIEIIGTPDKKGRVVIEPAPQRSALPAGIAVDFLLTAKKLRQQDSLDTEIDLVKFEPGFGGLSAAEIAMRSAAIGKVGMIITNSYAADIHTGKCGGPAHKPSVSLYAVELTKQQILASHRLLAAERQETVLITETDENFENFDCLAAHTFPAHADYFKLTEQ